MATVTLSAVKAGITRLRTKGGASPDSLYDLANGYVTAARTIAPRPGSEVSVRLPEGTIGLALHDGVFQVFAAESVGEMPPGYRLNVLSHPNWPPDTGEDDPPPRPNLKRIWKAEPLLGGLYVVAEWDDDPEVAYHYWIRSGDPWQPNTAYEYRGMVDPTVPNGLSYEAHRLHEAGTMWAPGVERAVDDVVEPTTFNGYEYVVVEAVGNPPRSGETEPRWVARAGALVIEEADVAPGSPGSGQPPPPPTPPGYGNPGGSVPPKEDTGGGGPSWQVQ